MGSCDMNFFYTQKQKLKCEKTEQCPTKYIFNPNKGNYYDLIVLMLLIFVKKRYILKYIFFIKPKS